MQHGLIKNNFSLGANFGAGKRRGMVLKKLEGKDNQDGNPVYNQKLLLKYSEARFPEKTHTRAAITSPTIFFNHQHECMISSECTEKKELARVCKKGPNNVVRRIR